MFGERAGAPQQRTRATLLALTWLALGSAGGCDDPSQSTKPASQAAHAPKVPAADPPKSEAEPAGASAPTSAPTGAAPTGNAGVDHEARLATLAALQGIDASKLTKGRKLEAIKMFGREADACGKPRSLLESLQKDAKCHDSRVIAQYIIDELGRGIPEHEVSRGVTERMVELQQHEVGIEGRPVYGDPAAPVTVVVFADFECPHCAAEAPKLQAAIDASGGKAKLVFRHFPLKGHDRGRRVALATEAALAQSNEKFWALHNIAFESQADFRAEPSEVEGPLREMAQKAGLDMARYDDFMKYERGAETLDADKAAGKALQVHSTPTVFVDGRRYSPFLFGGELSGWIDDALARR